MSLKKFDVQSLKTTLRRQLTSELYKIMGGLLPEIMKDVFPFNDNTIYNSGNKIKLHSRAIKFVTFGSETLSHLQLVPVDIKFVESVSCFKRSTKKMETNKLSFSFMPDVCFSGWFCVIYFMILHKPVLLFFLFLLFLSY